MLAVLNDWERVCAAEEIDLDEMDEVDERFAGALKQLNAVISRHARGLVTIAQPAVFRSGELITDPVIQQAAGRARSHH